VVAELGSPAQRAVPCGAHDSGGGATAVSVPVCASGASRVLFAWNAEHRAGRVQLLRLPDFLTVNWRRINAMVDRSALDSPSAVDPLIAIAMACAQRVVAGPTEQSIVTLLAVDHIAPCSPPEQIRPGASAKQVWRGCAGDHVGAFVSPKSKVRFGADREDDGRHPGQRRPRCLKEARSERGIAWEATAARPRATSTTPASVRARPSVRGRPRPRSAPCGPPRRRSPHR
jgi:hypothetical protein